MECHDARILLTFVQRRGETVDPGERAILQQHLDGCPDCSARAQAERQADDAIAKLMLDVPVPADLRAKVLTRMQAEAPRQLWPWAATAAAAVLLFSIAGASLWYAKKPPVVTFADIQAHAQRGVNRPEAELAVDFERHGVRMRLPGELKSIHLRRTEIVEFMNRRVARLTYRTIGADGSTVLADVLVLPHRQFRVHQLQAGTIQGGELTILQDEDFTYVIFHSGNFQQLLRPAV